jgi:catechol 2,3-dioxygenase
MEVERVALRVSDVGRSADFYARIAGLSAREADADHALLGAPDGGPVRLELRRAERPGPAPRRAAGLFHTALRYPSRPQLAAALRRIAAEHQPLSGASDHLVSEALYLDDPDGLGIELYRDRPREQWPPPGDGERVRMDTLPLDLDDLLASGDGELPDAAARVDVGHVHLKVADVESAVAFWTGEAGLELMTRFGDDAAFLAADGYHHHIGVNTWLSRGAPLEPPAGPGIDEIILTSDGAAEADLRTPDGLGVHMRPPANG